MERFAALLRDKPADVDFSLFESSKEKKFVKDYYDRFGVLPEKEVFEQEFETTLPEVSAPWAFYEQKMKEERFIRQALPALSSFNENYERDQKQALISLRENLMSLIEPEDRLEPVSIVRDLSRYKRFKDRDNTRILTGLKPLDDASGGLSKKDEFMIISARLGVGKSWLTHYIAQSMCKAGYRVGIYSGEMSEDEVGARFDSLLSHVSNFALTRGREVNLEEHMRNLQQIEGDELVLTPRHLRHNATPSDLRKFAKEYQLDCLFIDQLSLMEPDGMRGGEDYERKARLSYQLKSLQQELLIPIVAVSQLNRGAAGQEADTSNIAGSDRIGQDATLILALARKDDVLKVKVLKARSFRVPEQPWEFTWDVDKGILEPRLSAMDSVRARVEQARARQRVEDDNARQAATQSGDADIW